MKEICLTNGKKKGGPWDCFDAANFFGWEADTVVVVTNGWIGTLEMMTRAKTQLIIITVDDGRRYYKKNQKHLQDAAAKGLVDLVAI